MNSQKRKAARLVVAGCLLCFVGCSDTPTVDTSTTEATVKGVVTIDGVKVKSGELSFDPSNMERTANKRNTTIQDGAYEIKTLTGRNTIHITGTIAKQKPLLQQQIQSFDVKEGENTFDMEFTAK